MKLNGPSDIKYYVRQWISQSKSDLQNKIVLDLPAGTGDASTALDAAGAQVKPYDLFPEFFKHSTLSCDKADLTKPLPIESEHADYVLCQEGIEHICDQLSMLCEFNRVLKDKGRLLITTPNYSNLFARTSYLLNESEGYKLMAPNELDSIWHSKSDNNIYFGHAFLIGIQRLRLLTSVAGFRIHKIHHTKISKASLLLFPFQYPFILLSNLRSYFRILKRNNDVPDKLKKSVYKNVLKLAINPKVLLDKALFIEFEKVALPNKNLEPYLPYAKPPA